jgi:hypothetical protein
MPLTIISRRSITFREPGTGEMTVLLVPGRDQIQVVKDLAGLNTAAPASAREAATAKAAGNIKKQVSLSRVHIGRRFIYGNLPTEIADLSQPVKVWLAEDFAPLQAQAFFYIISSKVVIHGVREQDDEGFQNWRTAQLAVEEADPLKSIINAISDYALANPTEGLTVAVFNKLDIYEKLQAELATYNISPIPFSRLKPQPNLKPLYKHRDYTILYLTLGLFGAIILAASLAYLAFNFLTLRDLNTQAEAIQTKINSIKFNQSVGQISDPQAILRVMSRSVNQQPSAILHAAGEVSSAFGNLSGIRLTYGGNSAPEATEPLGPGQLVVLTTVDKLQEPLLLTQEQKANLLLHDRPWVREIRRYGAVGERGELSIVLQIDQAPSATVPMPGSTEELLAPPVNPANGGISR